MRPKKISPKCISRNSKTCGFPDNLNRLPSRRLRARRILICRPDSGFLVWNTSSNTLLHTIDKRKPPKVRAAVLDEFSRD